MNVHLNRTLTGDAGHLCTGIGHQHAHGLCIAGGDNGARARLTPQQLVDAVHGARNGYHDARDDDTALTSMAFAKARAADATQTPANR